MTAVNSPHPQAHALARAALIAGLLLAPCLWMPRHANASALKGHGPNHRSVHAHARFITRRHALRLRDVGDVSAYQDAIQAAGHLGVETTIPADANHVELIVTTLFPASMFPDAQTQWQWTDPTTGNSRGDNFANDGRLEQSTIQNGAQVEFLGYPGREESIETQPMAVTPGSTLALLEASYRRRLGSAGTGWRDTGVTKTLRGHTLRLYESDGPALFADGQTGPSADVAYADTTTMLVYRLELYDLRHGQRTLVSGSDISYQVVPRAVALNANVFGLVHLNGFTAPPTVPNPK